MFHMRSQVSRTKFLFGWVNLQKKLTDKLMRRSEGN